MNTVQRRNPRIAAILLAAIALALGGCAAEGPVKPAGIEQMIETARTRANHLDIAASYEQEAERDKAAAERHRDLAQAYARGWVWAGPKVGGVVSASKGNQAFVTHCENLTRLYLQAAEENLTLAKAHRSLAADAKD